MSYDDDDGDGDDGDDCVDGVDGVDNDLPSVVAATVGVPPGQELDALLDTSKSRRGLNSEHEMYLFVFSSVFISNLYFFRVNQREDNQSQSKKHTCKKRVMLRRWLFWPKNLRKKCVNRDKM